MNLPNKLTIVRIILSISIVILLLFPFDAAGIQMLKLFVNESIVVDVKYIIAGSLFLMAGLTDFLDGYIARKNGITTDLGKMLDTIADKVLVNSVLIVLSAQGFIQPIIPVIIIMRDSIVNSIKMAAGNKGQMVSTILSGKIKTICLMLGITLTLFYNLPFELWNLRISDFLLIIAVVLAVVSGFEYYYQNKKYL